MRDVFADTAYWVALLNPKDQLHERAIDASIEYIQAQIVTSELVLTELLNAFAGYGPELRTLAATTVAALYSSAKVTVAANSPKAFNAALNLYRERADKDWSLTDCSSFLVMRQMEIEAALTYDKHFVQAGFKALLR